MNSHVLTLFNSVTAMTAAQSSSDFEIDDVDDDPNDRVTSH